MSRRTLAMPPGRAPEAYTSPLAPLVGTALLLELLREESSPWIDQLVGSAMLEDFRKIRYRRISRGTQ